MGARERQIIASVIRELGGKGEHEIERGKVEEVNLTDYTIDVEISEGVTIHDVRLSAIVQSNLAVIEVPKVGSYVVIAKMEAGVDYVLVKASQIDKWLLKIGNTTFEIDSSLIKANGGTNGGLVKVAELTDKLNAIEAKVNAIISAFNTHAHPYLNAATPSVTSVTPTVIAGSLSPTQQSQIEDTKFTH